jgi:hypothetical protein
MNHQIQPNKVYTLNEIHNNRFFYWINSIPTLSRWVNRDIISDNRLKAIKKPIKNGWRYYIKGENIIKYLAAFEDGTLYGKGVDKMSDEQPTAPMDLGTDELGTVEPEPQQEQLPIDEPEAQQQETSGEQQQ